MTSTRRVWTSLGAALALGIAAPVPAPRAVPEASAAPPALAHPARSVPRDSAAPLAEVSRAAAACRDDCRGVVYLWSPRMPLARAGIPNALRAARTLGVPIALVSAEELQDYAVGGEPAGGGGLALADAMLRAGALAHAPALVVHSGANAVGAAILGYKSAEAYTALLDARLSAAVRSPATPTTPGITRSARPLRALRATDYEAIGVPGAYFRWVPGTRMLAYESDRTIYLLDLTDGENRVAPGWIDFVPTPDGRYFVTPGPEDEGLQFFDAREVLDAAASGRSRSVEPIFTDLRMRDQYPSIGILERDGARTRYRVLTSWFTGIVYRDYDVRVNAESGASSVRPVGEAVVPCAGYQLSTPIMSQNGREVAARDEATGTTKIFTMLEERRCEEALDLGASTSKVAWHASGRRLAFSLPRRSRADGSDAGIFVLDRDSGETVRVTGSEVASRLAFPEFVGDASVVFLVPAGVDAPMSVFRLVDGIE